MTKLYIFEVLQISGHYRILSENSLKLKNQFLYFASGAILTTEKNCSLKSNWDHKLLIMESYIEISPVVLEL